MTILGFFVVRVVNSPEKKRVVNHFCRFHTFSKALNKGCANSQEFKNFGHSGEISVLGTCLFISMLNNLLQLIPLIEELIHQRLESHLLSCC